LVAFCHACAKKELPPSQPALPAQTRAAALREAGQPEATTVPSRPNPATATSTNARLGALANGRRIRIRKLEEGIEELEITVPPGFKLRMEGSEELPASAHLVGPDLEIIVRAPEAGFFTLAQEKGILMRAAEPPTFIRAEEEEDGFLLIDENRLSGDDLRFDTTVSRPKLKVQCLATGLKRLSDAERVATVCLTLRAR
jgi:hypothetical protein